MPVARPTDREMGCTAPWCALASHWRVLDSGADGGTANMATDTALMAHARRSGEATLRVYAWERPTLSLGRHERARGVFDPNAFAAHGIAVVRRPTGGRALLHDHEVTYSVTAPATLSLGESYRAINALLRKALLLLGVDAREAAPPSRPLRPDGAACFDEPAAGELVVGGAKLVGSAQLREDGALLQHGSILLADDQPRIAALRVPGGASLLGSVRRAATLSAVLRREVRYGEVRDALCTALATGTDAVPLEQTSLRDDLARQVIAFARPEWTWRR